MTQAAEAGHGYSYGYYNGPATYYAPQVSHYSPPVSYVYQPTVVRQVVYRAVPVVHAPAVRYVHAPVSVPSYTRTTKYDPYGRFARITRKTYTPYGTAETKYRFDKKYGTWRVKYDFDD